MLRQKLAATLLTVAVAASPITLSTARQVSKHMTTRATVVVDVDETSDRVTVEDSVGFLWAFDGTEDWCLGDGCELLMYDNGTPNDITDDIILRTSAFRIDLLVNAAFYNLANQQ